MLDTGEAANRVQGLELWGNGRAAARAASIAIAFRGTRGTKRAYIYQAGKRWRQASVNTYERSRARRLGCDVE